MTTQEFTFPQHLYSLRLSMVYFLANTANLTIGVGDISEGMNAINPPNWLSWEKSYSGTEVDALKGITDRLMVNGFPPYTGSAIQVNRFSMTYCYSAFVDWFLHLPFIVK
ncbi:hypothetical protein A3K63_05270 [Candidatus Micrarchaeota archaeon RBG_16_49_10]|nr:MAG: hypothetical protein A3K63_05270 [Candidatus Micrarchaeota archaeon RBG_16_49_10]